MVDSLAGAVSRATHQAKVRTLVQPSGKEPVTLRRAVWSQKHSQGGAPSRALETSSPKDSAVGGRQRETQPTKKEVWTLSKLEDVSTPA
jgi:hypothetical protein